MSAVTVTVADDQRRVVEIDKYRVLTRPPRKDLLALVEIAARVAAVPMATINLITETEQHQIAAHGFDAGVCAREDSMCNLVLHVGHPVIVADASRDPRFSTTPSSPARSGTSASTPPTSWSRRRAW